MALALQLPLTADEIAALTYVRDHAPAPYLRERAAALLKVAAGSSARAVAQSGLLRPRYPDTVAAWVARYRTAGLAGLTVTAGRGRKPAFSPSAPGRGRRHLASHRRPVAPPV